MVKAYDLGDLVSKLKGRGMDVAEDAAKIVVEETLNWFQESAVLSGSKYDDMALIILPMVKTAALGLVDKIDGQEG